MPRRVRTDIAIVLPPVTEARLFPYSSLPMLAAFLRRHDVRVLQRDLNLEFSRRLLAPQNFESYQATKSAARDDLGDALRSAMASYLRDSVRSHLRRVSVRPRTTSSEGMRRSLRFLRQGLDLLLEESCLVREADSIKDVYEAADRAVAMDTSDLALDAARRTFTDFLDGTNARVLAFSIPFFSQILPTLIMTRWIRQQSPGTKVILGGPQVMLWQSELAECLVGKGLVDFLGTGKGEETLLGLHRSLANDHDIADVPDLVSLAGRSPLRNIRQSRISLNSLPVPDFRGLPVRRYFAAEPQLGLITCIGCYWGRCTFCSYGNRSRRARNYEQASPRTIADHCQALLDRHGISRINFVDENTNLRLIVRAMKILHERGHRIKFSTRNRLEPSLLNLSFCRELRALGCVLMGAGFESTSQRLLDELDRGIRADAFEAILDNLEVVGIPVRLSWMGGIVSETNAEFEQSRDFLRRNQHRIGIEAMEMLVLEPETYLAENSKRNGIRVSNRSELRGNDELSLGLGRMGYRFEYEQGLAFFDRKNLFSNALEGLAPQQNDELPPLMRDPTDEVRAVPHAVRLHSWVKVRHFSGKAGSRRKTILLDLCWQKLYALPPGVLLRRVSDDRYVLSMRKGARLGVMEEICQADLGTAWSSPRTRRIPTIERHRR